MQTHGESLRNPEVSPAATWTKALLRVNLVSKPNSPCTAVDAMQTRSESLRNSEVSPAAMRTKVSLRADLVSKPNLPCTTVDGYADSR